MNNDIGFSSKGSISSFALRETLELLEWPLLCEQLSTFASTAQGCRGIKGLELPPDIATSRQRLAETLELGELDALLEGGLSFSGVHDLAEIISHCSKGGVVSGEDLLAVAETLASARRLRRQIDNSNLRPVTTRLLEGLATLPELEKLLKFGLEEGGRIADRASQMLSRLRQQANSLRTKRKDLLNEVIKRSTSKLQDLVIGERYGRPVLSLKAGSVNQLRGMIHGSSASGNTVFLEPDSVIPIGNKLAEIDTHISKEEYRLLSIWSAEVGKNFSALENLENILLVLDIALARARYGLWLGGVAPTLLEDAEAPFTFKELRHPLLVWKELHLKGQQVVPISLDISSHLRVVAITGPNTGGKTVALKTIGLATVMARAGLLLPCLEGPSLPWCQNIFADIGDEQSLQQSLSTFSSHITRIDRILKSIDQTTGPSLVLLDEVGAGTDPTEGTALAIALLRTLAERVRLTVATTHFGQLKALKYRDKRFENASVSFDNQTITPTYRLQWGIPGSSNALSIATRLGLDAQVVHRAEELIGPNGLEDVNVVIRGLEEQRTRQQEAAEDAASLLARTELLHEELLTRWKQQCELSEQVKVRRLQQLEISILEGQKEVRSLIRRLREKGADGELARKAGQRLRRIEQEHHQLNDSKQNIYTGWIPKVGDRVRLRALGKAGEVLNVAEDGLNLTVLCGVFRSIVSLSEVESLDGLKPDLPSPVVKVDVSSFNQKGSNFRTKRNTLDVRGMRVHEAESVLEEYLRQTIGPVWVVHGVGSGKLRQGLRHWLSGLSYIEKVSDADSKDGGPGCTVIWLRH